MFMRVDCESRVIPDNFWSPSCCLTPASHQSHEPDQRARRRREPPGRTHHLVGSACRGTAGRRMPNFAGDDERVRAALLRVRPRLILVDCDHEEACTDEFVGPAIMTGARVILFRSNRSIADRTEFSDRLGLRVVDMPKEHDSITELLGEMLEG
jgi:hypothetical protein